MTSKQKKSKATWSDVKSKLADVDRVGLIGLILDLYAANKDNQTFLHARSGWARIFSNPIRTRFPAGFALLTGVQNFLHILAQAEHPL
ncbi:hypothetical protein [Methylomonas sp. HYX-M1]|uniref:hypothetical protein n=1 Tax=Methylomonas sp. HYX-M1 TaxID=3139307 RepID=UPI00345C44C6